MSLNIVTLLFSGSLLRFRKSAGKVCLFWTVFVPVTDSTLVYLIFVVWDIFEVLVIYFFAVETKVEN